MGFIGQDTFHRYVRTKSKGFLCCPTPFGRGSSLCSLNLATPARSAPKMDHSVHVRCVERLSVSPVEMQVRTSASIAKSQDVRSVMSILLHEHVTAVASWYVKTTDQRSMKPRFVRTVGRGTNDWETCSNWDG
jgi:hypothetical protein